MGALLKTQKQLIRAQVRAARRARSPESMVRAGTAIEQRLAELTATLNARTVACYLPLAGEPDTTGFIDWASRNDVALLLPSSRPDGLLDWIRWVSSVSVSETATLTVGAFGISEPRGERLPPSELESVDLVIAPACAVDRRGVRLGWGRGYYDRTLAALDTRPPVYAVVYDDEVFDALPHEAHDVPLEGAVTPEQTLRF